MLYHLDLNTTYLPAILLDLHTTFIPCWFFLSIYTFCITSRKRDAIYTHFLLLWTTSQIKEEYIYIGFVR